MCEYTIPEKYDKMIDKELLTKIRDNVFKIFEGIGMDIPTNEGMDYVTTTAGWDTAIGIACIESGKEGLYRYYANLSWMDSDIFDGIIVTKMVEENLILDDAINLYKKILNLDVDYCISCSELRDKKDLVKDENLDRYICLKCKENKEIKNYSCYEEEFKKILPKALNKIKTQEIIKCSKCNIGFYKYQGTFENNKFICNHCKEMEDKEGVTFAFYKTWSQKLEKYKEDKK